MLTAGKAPKKPKQLITYYVNMALDYTMQAIFVFNKIPIQISTANKTDGLVVTKRWKKRNKAIRLVCL